MFESDPKEILSETSQSGIYIQHSSPTIFEAPFLAISYLGDGSTTLLYLKFKIVLLCRCNALHYVSVELWCDTSGNYFILCGVSRRRLGVISLITWTNILPELFHQPRVTRLPSGNLEMRTWTHLQLAKNNHQGYHMKKSIIKDTYHSPDQHNVGDHQPDLKHFWKFRPNFC